MVVMPGKLPDVVKLLQQQQKAVQFDGQRILWRGIKVFDDLTVRRGASVHPSVLDQAMIARLPDVAAWRAGDGARAGRCAAS